MKIAFIAPTWEKFPHWPFHFPQLGPLTVAGLTPSGNEIEFIDERATPIGFDIEADVIAISSMTAQAARAYQIADEFRRRGKIVIIGGIHPTLMPEEAESHADSVVVGEAEAVWETVIKDLEEGRLKKRYTVDKPANEFCEIGRFPRRDLIAESGTYTRAFDGTRAIDTLQTTRGCIYDCEHCNVPSVYGRRLRSRPIDDVMAEIDSIKAKNVFIVDNLVYENRSYFMRLMRRLRETPKKWFAVGSLKMAEDREFLDEMSKSGCAFIYVGFDHLYENTYQSVRKSGLPGHYKEDVKIHDIDYGQDHIRLKEQYMGQVKIIQEAGIGVFGTFAFGFDTDDEGVFERTIDFALEVGLAFADFAILTPYPKSPLFNRLISEGRLFDTDWSHYNGCHVVFEPKRMSKETLKEGWRWAWDRFYEHKSVLRRLCEAFLPKGIKNLN